MLASVPLELLVRGSGGGMDFVGLRPVVLEPADMYNGSVVDLLQTVVNTGKIFIL